MNSEELLKHLLAEEPLPGKRVLDYGCGDGRFGVWMATQDAEVTLLDKSRAAVDQALQATRAAGAGRRVKGVEARSADLPMFADSAFDIILLHGDSPFHWDELARILRPDARIIADRPIDAGPSGAFVQVREHAEAHGVRLPWKHDAPLLWSARRRAAA